MFLTKKQLEEISRQIATISVKDTDFDETHSIRQGDSVAIVQDGKNKKIDIGELGGYFATIDERLIPDNEDIFVREDSNVLSFADRSYADGNGMGYVILRKNKTFAEQVVYESTIYEIRYDFDLNDGSVTIPSGCVLKFNGGSIGNGAINIASCEIFNGYFKNLAIIASTQRFVIKNTVFDNSKIYQEHNETVGGCEIDGCKFINVGNDDTSDSSIHCIFLNNVSNTLIRGCAFEHIGNLYAGKVSGISINTADLSYSEPSNENITVKDNTFNGLISKDNSSSQIGEYHAIIVAASRFVTIENNYIYNDISCVGYGKEPIYTKCTETVINGNKISGLFAGEAAICVKGFSESGSEIGNGNVDVINNYIVGTFFEGIYHTGVGNISDNTIINTYIFGISLDPYEDVFGNKLVLRDNYIECGSTAPSVYSGSARAPLTLINTESRKLEVLVDGIIIKSSSGDVSNITIRGGYDTKLSISNSKLLNNKTNGFYFTNNTTSPKIDIQIKDCTIDCKDQIFRPDSSWNAMSFNVAINGLNLSTADYIMYDSRTISGKSGKIALSGDIVCGPSFNSIARTCKLSSISLKNCSLNTGGIIRDGGLDQLTIENSSCNFNTANTSGNTIAKIDITNSIFAISSSRPDQNVFCYGTSLRLLGSRFVSTTSYDMKQSTFFGGFTRIQLGDNTYENSSTSHPVESCETAYLPSNCVVGQSLFDTTRDKPVWWNGTAWVDATGTTV